MTSDPHMHATPSLANEVRRATGLHAAQCYQCGKCSAGCPMAEEMPLKPHQVIRLVQLDREERIFEDESIWLCLTCETCTTRCPNGFDPARLMDGLRELVLRRHPDAAPRRIAAFHEAFLDQIRSHGRLFEMGLIVSYKLKTGALFDDVGSAPGMLARGKLKFFPQSIEGLDQVRRIFDACRNPDEEEA